MLQQAINHYHSLLDHDMAHSSWEQLRTAMHEHNLFFGERPLASVLRPRLITADQFRLLEQGCSLVGAAMRTLAERMLTDDSLRADLMLTTQEQVLINMHPGYAESSAHSRMDTFLTVDGSLQFVEYNGESPAAIAYEDKLSEAFREIEVMQAFAQRYRLAALPGRPYLLTTLLDTWRESGRVGAPTIAILDWSGLPTQSEFLMFQSYFREHGIDSIICTPDELVFEQGLLFARQTDSKLFRIDLVFKRILTSELLMHYGEHALEHPVVQAYAAGAICMVNSFRAKLLHKKSIFALLTEEANQDLFSPEQRAAITRHVPWTRVVRRGETHYQGERIDLLDFARRNRDRLLLKPNDEYGGKGIVIGWESDTSTWEQALQEAVQSPSVVQERVTIAYEEYPAWINGELHIGQRLVDSDPFMFGNEVKGCLSRLSTVTLLNVTAGGGSTVPVFVIESEA